MAQKRISCQQKQDDAASKKYFVRKKVNIFSGKAPHILALISKGISYCKLKKIGDIEHKFSIDTEPVLKFFIRKKIS